MILGCQTQLVAAGKLVSDLGSATWKHRNAAVELVEGILTSAGNRIQTPTAGLLPALKVLLALDSYNRMDYSILTRAGNRIQTPMAGLLPALKVLLALHSHLRINFSILTSAGNRMQTPTAGLLPALKLDIAPAAQG